MRDLSPPPGGSDDTSVPSEVAEITVGCCEELDCASGTVCSPESCACIPDQSCCSNARCAAEGKVCDSESCSCVESDCCTEEQCRAVERVCNTGTCVCEKPSCCTEEMCAPFGQACDPNSCACVPIDCCSDQSCAAQSPTSVCDTETCECRERSCCEPGGCGDGEFCNLSACECQGCCSELECASQGLTCNETTCQCEEQCCSDSSCGERGLECDESSCQCVQPECCTPESCAAVGKKCDPNRCVCEERECCTPTSCSAGGLRCNESTCECVAPESDTCVRTGDPCDPESPQPVAFVCAEDEAGEGVCRDFCVLDEREQGDPCPPGFFCDLAPGQAGPERVGSCTPSECTSYFANDCAGGQTCFPRRSSAYVCVDAGTRGEGESCGRTADCAPDLICGGGSCTGYDCAPSSGAPGCPSGEVCVGLTLTNGTPIDIGFCTSRCDAFSNQCGSNQWCLPNSRSAAGALEGACIGAFAGEAGAACVSHLECGRDLVCDRGACRPVCDPMDDSTCPTSENRSCQAVELPGGGVEPFGACYDDCDFHGGVACSAAGTQCRPGELIGADADACVVPPEPPFPLGENELCTGFDEFEFCQVSAACLDLGDDLRCYRLCMSSEGPLEQAGHPDCDDPGQSCQQLFQAETAFGVCLD